LGKINYDFEDVDDGDDLDKYQIKLSLLFMIIKDNPMIESSSSNQSQKSQFRHHPHQINHKLITKILVQN
jgi:hypothetical protein